MSWKISFVCEPDHADEFSAVLEDRVAAVAWFETSASSQWAIEATTPEQPVEAEIKALLLPLCTAFKIPLPVLKIEEVPETDWLEATQRNFPPQKTGRYYIHGSHTPPLPLKAGFICLEINAATAFGSGEHETTATCLLVLDQLARQGQKFDKALDMGCGSGILAIAIAKTWNIYVTAADNDPESVRVTTQNALSNACGNLLQAYASDGFDNKQVQDQGSYDLIIANILANPLIEMAGALSANLAEKGMVVLSGLLTHQAEGVLKAYGAYGLTLLSRKELNGWEALLLGKP